MNKTQTRLLHDIERSAARLAKGYQAQQAERAHLYILLRKADRAGISRSDAIRASGVSRKTFYRLVAEWEAA